MIASDLKKLTQLVKEQKWEQAAEVFDKLSVRELSDEDASAMFQAVLTLHLHLNNQMDSDYVSFLKKKIQGTRSENVKQAKNQDQKHLEAVRSFLKTHARDAQPHDYKF